MIIASTVILLVAAASGITPTKTYTDNTTAFERQTCDPAVVAAIVRTARDESDAKAPVTLETFLRSSFVAEAPDLAAAGLAALWVEAPAKAAAIYAESPTPFLKAQEAIRNGRGRVPNPCLSSEQFLPLWPRVKAMYSAALHGDDLWAAIPGAPYVLLYARYTCFQMQDCYALKWVDRAWNRASDRIRERQRSHTAYAVDPRDQPYIDKDETPPRREDHPEGGFRPEASDDGRGQRRIHRPAQAVPRGAYPRLPSARPGGAPDIPTSSNGGDNCPDGGC